MSLCVVDSPKVAVLHFPVNKHKTNCGVPCFTLKTQQQKGYGTICCLQATKPHTKRKSVLPVLPPTPPPKKKGRAASQVPSKSSVGTSTPKPRRLRRLLGPARIRAAQRLGLSLEDPTQSINHPGELVVGVSKPGRKALNQSN